MPGIKTLVKHCAHCFKKMERDRFNGRLEDFTIFQKRLYCDRDCMATAMQTADPSRHAYARRARKVALKANCEKCGTTAKLAIHHDDLNWRNNSLTNLHTLCGSCHTFLHHARGDIKPAQPKPPCKFCAKPSFRSGVCNTCRTQIRRYGAPRPSTSEPTC